MSIKATDLVWAHSRAIGNARLVLLAIADHANDRGECWPSLARLAEMCRIDVRSVRRNLAALEAAGEITRTLKTGRKTTYRIALTPDAGVPPDATVTPDAGVPPPRTLASETPDAGVPLTVKNHHRTVITPPLIPPAEDERENEPSGTGRSETQDAGKGGAVASAADAENETATDAESPAGGNSGGAGGDKPKPQSAKRGCRLPSNFWPDDTGLRVFLECNGTDIAAAVEHFADYWQARAGAGGVKLDWQATWRNWCRNAAQRYGSAGFGAGNRAQPRYREPGLENLFAAASRGGD